MKINEKLISDTGWVDLELLNGVTARETRFYYKPQIRKINNIVYLKGQVTIPAHSSRITLAKIPSEFNADYERKLFGLTANNWIDGGGSIQVSPDNTQRNDQSLDSTWMV